ncbi:MAG: hypothetical protein AB7O62_19100 [Pirellulales bacterium]
MPIELRWLASASTSCFHAVDLSARCQPLADVGLAAALALPTQALLAEFGAFHTRSPNPFEHLLPLSAGIGCNRELAEVVLRKTCGGSSGDHERIAMLAGHFSDLERAFIKYCPEIVDQLTLRSEPLRQQWEARGPGLMRGVGRLTEPELIVESADVILVHPARGGGGAAHLLYNSVRIEAVLANALHELPEVLRLGWLVAQLNSDLPRYQGEIPRPSLRRVAALALLPALLAAAEQVELARCDEPTLVLALRAWVEDCQPDVTAGLVWRWWQTYLDSRPRWDVALAALNQMAG